MVIDKCKNCCYTEVASKKIDESEGIAMKKNHFVRAGSGDGGGGALRGGSGVCLPVLRRV